jgi:FkbM family methyltransferase
MKIAIIDIIGIPYDGTTVFKQGLGGSESAVTFIAKELAKIGFEVTVFNNCNIDHAEPGTYDNVIYRPLSALAQDYIFDIVISSRTVIPFTDPKDYVKLKDNRALPFASMNLYDRILNKAKIRALWMHDTFCLGDNLIEELTTSNRITDIFTLSDWHLTYITNCDHGKRRNFEVLKRKMFITRNGVNIYNKEVDIKAKDKDLFVYNASVTKGMIPLVKQIWPHVKRHIPTAKLKVIGGYYRFSNNTEPDQQEKDWRQMADDPELVKLGIEFTGIIPQKEIADILTKANFMVYPAAFPETFGISTLESICYNTPLVTCRFGALEEIALENSCYLIDYAIQPNGLFPNINVPHQIEQFVKTLVEAYRNPYLHQQKQYYCNIVKDIAGWDTVALQWKQFFYHKTKKYLNKEEYRKVSNINKRWHKIFKRRYHNIVELEDYKAGNQQRIVVISPMFNAKDYIAKCIESVTCQDYDNYHMYIIDDASTDNSYEIAKAYESNHITVLRNSVNQGAVYNQIQTIKQYCNDNDIVILLDGDDCLVNDNTIFNYYNNLYDETTEFSYGSCWSMADNIPLVSQPYPISVKESKSYREHHFNWILPYTHLRTFKKYLLNKCNDIQFQDSEGCWFRAGGDGSVFYALIEAADPNKVKVVQDIIYNYNDKNPLNDYKVNSVEQNKTAKEIINMNQKKRILIAIPTAKNIEPETFKSIYDLIIPEGYQTTFQYFYGYNIDQIRNLIADWVVKGYDYLFSVDSDIAFTPDTLLKLLSHDKDVVSGLYIQRKPGEHILEIYEHNERGGVSNVSYGKIKGQGLVEIAGCGFGCVLVKSKVFKEIGYPYFKYHSALDHKHTISEDVDFCRKALSKGFKIWADTSIQCRHIGSTTFTIDNNISEIKDISIETRLRELGNQRLIAQKHVDYLRRLKDSGFEPKIIYDIGACVLHWTNEAERIWPDAEYIAFEAMNVAEFLYKERNLKYHIGVLSDQTGKEVDFYQNNIHPGGNSYYKENEAVNPQAPIYFNESHKTRLITVTLDAVVRLKQFPLPDLIKMDVQGAELDILKGAGSVLSSSKHVILELQRVEYNKGAPLNDTVIAYMDSIGFDCLGEFSSNGPDGDYHFVKR